MISPAHFTVSLLGWAALQHRQRTREGTPTAGRGQATNFVLGRFHGRQRAVLMAASGQLRGRLRAVCRGRRQTPPGTAHEAARTTRKGVVGGGPGWATRRAPGSHIGNLIDVRATIRPFSVSARGTRQTGRHRDSPRPTPDGGLVRPCSELSRRTPACYSVCSAKSTCTQARPADLVIAVPPNGGSGHLIVQYSPESLDSCQTSLRMCSPRRTVLAFMPALSRS